MAGHVAAASCSCTAAHESAHGISFASTFYGDHPVAASLRFKPHTPSRGSSSGRKKTTMEGDGRKETEPTAAVSRAQKDAAAAGVTVRESLQHAWASFLGLVRKVTARSEEEAAEADMRAAKMQVEATDEAEARKKQLAD